MPEFFWFMEKIMVEKKPPFELTLIITHRCNLNCVYCYEHHKDSRKMDVEFAKKTVEKYLTTGDYEEIKIGFFGGEPFLEFPIIKEVCEWTWSRNWPKSYCFYADTNGTVLADEIKEWLVAHKSYFYMCLSLDGAKKTHDLNRSNSFDKINLDFFHKNWPDEPVKMTISDKNLSDLAEDFIFIHEKGFKINGSNFAEGQNIKDPGKNLEIITEQLFKLADWYVAHPEVEPAQIFTLPLARCEAEREYRKQCGIGGNGMRVIDLDGQEYFCTYSSSVSMNEEQIAEIKKMDLSDENLFINDDCFNNCYLFPVCVDCYAANFASTGSFAEKSQLKCELAKIKAVANAYFQGKRFLSRNMSEITEKEKQTIKAVLEINSLFGGKRVR